MMKFTKEEISLCKQVVEKYGKEIGKGSWLYSEGKVYLVVRSMPEGLNLYVTETGQVITSDYDFIPLWTISDCLEFLKERCKDHVLLIHEEGLEDDEEWYLWFDEYKETQQWDKGKTPLEACLKAVLAVLGDSNG